MGLDIVFTHNLNKNNTPEEAEYDDAATVAAIVAALERAGHTVTPWDVGGPLAGLVSRLESRPPDLIFNTAEGARGRHREAFYPAMFDTLSIPYTGSDASVCMTTLDKAETKRRLAACGVPTPASVMAVRGDTPGIDMLKFPVILKPNFEGSSLGISHDSVVEGGALLKSKLAALLEQFPDGVLVEEFIEGTDVAIPYLAGVGPEVLDIIEYIYKGPKRRHTVYGYDLKHELDGAVDVRVPAALDAALAARLREWTRAAVGALSIRDLCRADFRISAAGEPYFIEINALPSLQPNAGMFLCAEKHGLDFDATINAVVDAACARLGLNPQKSRVADKKQITVAFTYNIKRANVFEDDCDAEFDSPEAIEAITQSLAASGHRIVPMEAGPELPARLAALRPGLVFNIAEGRNGRGREAQVPALCELLGIEHIGSDPAAFCITLDKALTKTVLQRHGIPTPGFFVLETGGEPVPRDMKFPLIVKPNCEGTSKGIGPHSIVDDEPALRALAESLIRNYRQPAIAEEYIAGRELSVALIGWPEPEAYPIMEVVFLKPGDRTVYGFELKQEWDGKLDYVIPAPLDEPVRRACEDMALRAFKALGCRDIGRVDFRLAHDGSLYVIEINPLPGMSPEFSDLSKIAAARGMNHVQLIRTILDCGLKRLGEPRK